MEKVKDFLIAVLFIFLMLQLPSCYSGDGPEKDEARAEAAAYEAEIQKEAYEYGYADAKRYSDELHKFINDWYDEDFLAVENLYEILCEEYGEYKGNEIFDTIMGNSMNHVICPADLVNQFLGDPDNT